MRYHCATSALPAFLRADMTLAETLTGSKPGYVTRVAGSNPPPLRASRVRNRAAIYGRMFSAGDWRSW